MDYTGINRQYRSVYKPENPSTTGDPLFGTHCRCEFTCTVESHTMNMSVLKVVTCTLVRECAHLQSTVL